jgi:hypothetical protein
VGSWGLGVEEDDFVLDVIGEFNEVLKHGGSVDSATAVVLERFAEARDDPDDGPLLPLAIAQAQWTYGLVASEILSRISAYLESGAGLERWAEESPAVLEKRVQRLHAFVERVREPNPRPRRFPKVVVRKPVFQAGDCLSVDLGDGRFGAALVLVADHSREEYGKNLVGVLDYLETRPPDEAIFRRRKWLRLTHHSYTGELDLTWYLAHGFRSARQRFTVVGTVPILRSDPTEGRAYHAWRFLGDQVVYQRKWDAAVS